MRNTQHVGGVYTTAAKYGGAIARSPQALISSHRRLEQGPSAEIQLKIPGGMIFGCGNWGFWPNQAQIDRSLCPKRRSPAGPPWALWRRFAAGHDPRLRPSHGTVVAGPVEPMVMPPSGNRLPRTRRNRARIEIMRLLDLGIKRYVDHFASQTPAKSWLR